MKKPIIRQLKKAKGGNDLVLCIAPENREKLGANEGDNLLQRYNPDSEIIEVSKIVQSSNRQQNETCENAEDETHENKSRVDLAGETEQNPPTEQVNEISHRIDVLEEDIAELLNNKSGKDEDLVPVGAGSDEDEHNPEPEYEQSRFAKFVGAVTLGFITINEPKDEDLVP